MGQRYDVGTQEYARTLLLGTRAVIAPAGHTHHDVGVCGPSLCRPGTVGSYPKFDQPRTTTRPTAHQRANDDVVRKAGRYIAIGVVHFHEGTVIEAARISYLRDLGQPFSCEAKTVPAVTIPS